MEGVFWFCEPSRKTMKKLTKLKNNLEAEIKADTKVGIAEMKTAVNDLKPRSATFNPSQKLGSTIRH